MKPKTYRFPKTGGGTLEKNLARPTNDRIERFLKLLGKSSFRELLSPQGQLEYGAYVLDLAVSQTALSAMLDVCLTEGSDGIDMSELDMTIPDEAIQDFFEQRSKTFIARLQK